MATVKYTPDPAGLREIARSSGVQGAAVAGARAIAAAASADDPSGAYEAQAATVVAGWNNEQRAGARAVETKRGAGARRRSLARASREARS